jgi:hypothetical protein
VENDADRRQALLAVHDFQAVDPGLVVPGETDDGAEEVSVPVTASMSSQSAAT